MPANDYPVDVRVAYPERSSRGWAALTIFLIKFLCCRTSSWCCSASPSSSWPVPSSSWRSVVPGGDVPVREECRAGPPVSAFVLSLTDRYPFLA
jgi:hypothetical protein